MRSVFVHPEYARCGIARTTMAVIEAEIVAAGFEMASLTATLSGIPFYRRLGYRGCQPASLRLRDGLTFMALSMEKSLVRVARVRSRAA